MSLYVAGLDLGQAQDFSALTIAEIIGTPIRLPYDDKVMGLASTSWLNMQVLPVVRFNFRHIERFPLGTKYARAPNDDGKPGIAELVRERLRALPKPWYLAIDRTGVGRPVMAQMESLNPIGISITAGKDVTPATDHPQSFNVPKRDLVSALQVPSQQRTLKFAAGLEHAETLSREMLNFRAKISTSGADTYEAWREADHDDLVLAAAITCWTAVEILRLREAQARDAIRRAGGEDYQISPV